MTGLMPLGDTIAAIATPPGNGAIGIIRISGPNAKSLFGKFWAGSVPSNAFKPKQIYVGNIKDLKTGAVLDHVLVFFMNAPWSSTGEDVIEIQAHGGQRLMEVLLEIVLNAGARLAQPGEFTRRAFLNGRLDLAQAEAVGDLIQASSETALRMAARQLEGSLSETVQKLRNDLMVLRAQMEAMIDFPEDEDVQGLYSDEILGRVDHVATRIRKLLTTYEEGRPLREGVRVALVGKPNVGKSSLFNALLNENRAIIHPAPGTTRDLVEEVLELDGLMVRFIDTAGIRQIYEDVEAEGIRRTHERLTQVDLVLAVFDLSRPWDAEDDRVLECVSGTRYLLIGNKCDLTRVHSRTGLRPVAAKENLGIEELRSEIRSLFMHPKRTEESSGPVLSRLRHKVSLEHGLQSLGDVARACREGQPLEVLSSELSIAMDRLGEITGEVTNDEILGEIFSKFCIGK